MTDGISVLHVPARRVLWCAMWQPEGVNDQPAPTEPIRRVSLFITCMVDVFAPGVGESSVAALRASGCEVSCPLGQTCCGQPAWNSGFAADAARVARTSLDALEADSADAVVVPAGSCATMIKVFWPELFELAGDHEAAARARRLGAKTHELTSFLVARPTVSPEADRAVSRPIVAYHHSCHMLRELRIHDAPLTLLERAGCTVAEWPDGDRCCGFGGLFSVKLPETSVAMAEAKLASLPTDVSMVVGSDSSCLMHLAGRAEAEGRTIKFRHVAEVIAAMPSAARRS